MVDNKIPESEKELLRDGSFILWCLTPTKELDDRWRIWVEKHPERSEDLSHAKRIIQSTKLNKYTLTSKESGALYTRLSDTMNRRKKQKTIRLMLSAAACIAVLCMIATWIAYQGSDIISEKQLLSAEIKIDSTQTEVELELSESEKMLIDNKATIQLSTQGTIQITGTHNKTVPAPASANKDKKEVTGSKMNILKVPNGRHSSLVLADGTKVWVNSGTILSFPSTFDTDNRTISVNGEVYLEVAKDASRPFYVKTSQMDVRVLGTTFNVTAYNEDKTQSVILAEGSVEVVGTTGLVRKMQPEEMLVLEDNRMNVSHVDVYNYISWKDGLLQFDRKNIGYVIQRLSRYYGMKFECSQDIQDYVCSGKLVLFDDITSVMTTLKESFPISYEREGDKIKLSRNYKK